MIVEGSILHIKQKLVLFQSMRLKNCHYLFKWCLLNIISGSFHVKSIKYTDLMFIIRIKVKENTTYSESVVFFKVSKSYTFLKNVFIFTSWYNVKKLGKINCKT